MTVTTTNSPRARRPRPKLVTLTDAAASRVRDILDEHGQGYLRVGVTNGGCAGMEYIMAVSYTHLTLPTIYSV